MTPARVILALVLLSSCRTATLPVAARFPRIAASSPAEAWKQLMENVERFRGARMLARFSGAQSFRAVVEISASGDLQIQMLSPLGTTVGVVDARGDTVSWTEEGRARTATLNEVSERLLGVSTGDLQSRDVAMLLIGLPPAPQGHRFAYEMTSMGLQSVRSGSIVVTYEPAIFPPKVVRMETPSGAVRLEVLELVRL